jgi:hypothetical protein
MHTPTKAHWQVVIDNFKKVLPIATKRNNLDMLEPAVNADQHKCGTVHCIGGWYAIATCDINKPLNYKDGALKMAEDLGFRDLPILQLEEWAINHPSIWGNRYGAGMFCNPSAYGNATNLAEAIQFLEKVRDRSPD